MTFSLSDYELMETSRFFITAAINFRAFSEFIEGFSGFFFVAVNLPVATAFAACGFVVYESFHVFGRITQKQTYS